jgi:hypothetical protein
VVEEGQVHLKDTTRHHNSNTHPNRNNTRKMATGMTITTIKDMTRIMIKDINLKTVLGEEEGMGTHRRIRIIHHSKNTMKMIEVCHPEGIVEDHLSRGLQQQEGEGMAGRVEDIQMALLRAEGGGLQG